jgi:hypothetical protein
MKNLWKIILISASGLFYLGYFLALFLKIKYSPYSDPIVLLETAGLFSFITMLIFFTDRNIKGIWQVIVRILTAVTLLGLIVIQVVAVFIGTFFICGGEGTGCGILGLAMLAIPLDIFIFILFFIKKQQKIFIILSTLLIAIPSAIYIAFFGNWDAISEIKFNTNTFYVNGITKNKPPFDTAIMPKILLPWSVKSTKNGMRVLRPLKMTLEDQRKQGFEFEVTPLEPATFIWPDDKQGTIKASLSGKITKVEKYDQGYNVFVETDYWISTYEQIDSLDDKIKVGRSVAGGQTIGKSNKLVWHFGRYYNGNMIDDYCPLDYADQNLAKMMSTIQIPDEYAKNGYNKICWSRDY